MLDKSLVQAGIEHPFDCRHALSEVIGHVLDTAPLLAAAFPAHFEGVEGVESVCVHNGMVAEGQDHGLGSCLANVSRPDRSGDATLWAMPPATVYVVYLPYLPLAERIVVGNWKLIPQKDLGDADALDVHTAELARGFAVLHDLRDATGAFGAFARPSDGSVGDDPGSMAPLVDLRRALLVAVLDGNQSPLTPKDEHDPNAGHAAMTSENALVVANGISYEGGYTGTRSGGRIPTLNIGVSVVPDPGNSGLPRSPKIPTPTDLLLPTMGRPLDHEYADAAWQSITRGTDAARRLGRAIEWLRLAWINVTELTGDLRIPALRAGFEVLFDSDEETVLAERLKTLVGDTTQPRLRQRAHPVTGKVWSKHLTDVEWWFWDFSFLRNDLMHGREPADERWLHEGQSHVGLGEAYLRKAIKGTIAQDGHQSILDDMAFRVAVREVRARLRASGDPRADD